MQDTPDIQGARLFCLEERTYEVMPYRSALFRGNCYNHYLVSNMLSVIKRMSDCITVYILVR